MGSKLFLGAIAGFIGALIIVIIIFLLSLLGIQVRLIPAISQLFVTDSLLGTFQANIVGLIAHFICGSIVGVAFLLALEITGYTHWILKGAAGGSAVWFLMCGILARILNLSMRSNAVNGLSNLFVHIVYGIIATWVIVHFNSKTKINNKRSIK